MQNSIWRKCVRRSSLSRLTSEHWLCKALNVGSQAKQITGQWLLLSLSLAQRCPGRSNIQFIKGCTPECATRRILYRQLDNALYLPIGIVPGDFPAAPACTPDETFAINCETIWHALLIWRMNEWPAILDSAGSSIKVVDSDQVQRRIGKVHEPLIEAPANAIGNTHIRFHDVQRLVGVKTIQAALRLRASRFKSAHCTCPETSLAINCSIVEACVRCLLLRVYNKLQSILPIPESEALFRRHNQATGCPYRQHAHRHTDIKRFELARAWFVAIETIPVDINQVQCLLLRMPDRSFPQRVLHGKHMFQFILHQRFAAPRRYSRMTSSLSSSNEVSCTRLSKVIVPCWSRFTRSQD